MQPPIGILGGTFDPVHNGHLRLAIELRDMLDLASVRLVPNARPPHRNSPSATPGQRAKWLRVAIADEPNLLLDDREIMRPGLSYSVDTLASLREDLPDTPLCLIMGEDVFAKLPEWHEWRELFDYAHIVLVDRPGGEAEFTQPVQQELEQRDCDTDFLRSHLNGGIHVCAPPPLAISSSHVRALLAGGRSPRYLLPQAVFDDILDSAIYSEKQNTP